jgi:hypothetical protein
LHPKLADILKPKVLKNLMKVQKRKLYDLQEGFFWINKKIIIFERKQMKFNIFKFST